MSDIIERAYHYLEETNQTKFSFKYYRHYYIETYGESLSGYHQIVLTSHFKKKACHVGYVKNIMGLWSMEFWDVI